MDVERVKKWMDFIKEMYPDASIVKNIKKNVLTINVFKSKKLVCVLQERSV